MENIKERTRIDEIKKICKEVESLPNTFEPFLIIGEEYVQGSKICNKMYINNDAPNEAKEAYEKFTKLIKRLHEIYEMD